MAHVSPLPFRRAAPDAVLLAVVEGVSKAFGLDRAGVADGAGLAAVLASFGVEQSGGNPAAGGVFCPRERDGDGAMGGVLFLHVDQRWESNPVDGLPHVLHRARWRDPWASISS